MSSPSSPCVKICVVDPLAGLCIGCGRTVEEISLWPEMAERARLAVMAELPGRMAAARSRTAARGRVRARAREGARAGWRCWPRRWPRLAYALGSAALGLSPRRFRARRARRRRGAVADRSGSRAPGRRRGARVGGRALWAWSASSLVGDLWLPLRVRRVADRVMEREFALGWRASARRRGRGRAGASAANSSCRRNVNGRARAFVFDTGASSVVLTAEDAAAAGVAFGATTSPSRHHRQRRDHGGAGAARPLAVGGIVVRDVPRAGGAARRHLRRACSA